MTTDTYALEISSNGTRPIWMGSWGDIGSNNSVYNGTYSQTPSNMNIYGIKYCWSVNCTDGTLWTNATYHFTTAVSSFIYIFDGHEYRKLLDFIPGATSPEKQISLMIQYV